MLREYCGTRSTRLTTTWRGLFMEASSSLMASAKSCFSQSAPRNVQVIRNPSAVPLTSTRAFSERMVPFYWNADRMLFAIDSTSLVGEASQIA